MKMNEVPFCVEHECPMDLVDYGYYDTLRR